MDGDGRNELLVTGYEDKAFYTSLAWQRCCGLLRPKPRARPLLCPTQRRSPINWNSAQASPFPQGSIVAGSAPASTALPQQINLTLTAEFISGIQSNERFLMLGLSRPGLGKRARSPLFCNRSFAAHPLDRRLALRAGLAFAGGGSTPLGRLLTSRWFGGSTGTPP